MTREADDRDRQSDECERVDFCRSTSLIDGDVISRLHQVVTLHSGGAGIQQDRLSGPGR